MAYEDQTYGTFPFDPFGIWKFWASLMPTAPFYGVDYRAPDSLNEFSAFFAAFGWRPLDDGPDAPEDDGAVIEAAAVEVDGEAEASADDLTRIKGVGIKTAAELSALGVTRFAQLAAYDADALAALDAKLSGIKGACIRGDWAGQARALAG